MTIKGFLKDLQGNILANTTIEINAMNVGNEAITITSDGDGYFEHTFANNNTFGFPEDKIVAITSVTTD